MSAEMFESVIDKSTEARLHFLPPRDAQLDAFNFNSQLSIHNNDCYRIRRKRQ